MSTEHHFTPVLDSPDRIAAARFSVPNNSNKHWNFVGCRHGLAILVNMWLRQVMVWDPLTGQEHRVACPPGLVFDPEVHLVYWEAAVMCADAEDGHVHGDCFSRPLKLVLIWVIGYRKAFACLYESASGLWGDIVSMESTDAMLGIRPGILVGSALCWVLCGGNVLVFDVQSQHLDLIKRPVDCPMNTTSYGFVQVLRMDDNRLGLAYLSKLTILLWERKSNCDGVITWVCLQKSIQLEELFPQRMFSRSKKIIINGYGEDTNVIVLSTGIGNFMLQLDSMQLKHIIKRNDICFDTFYPYTNFYTAGNTYLSSTLQKQNRGPFILFCWPSFELLLVLDSCNIVHVIKDRQDIYKEYIELFLSLSGCRSYPSVVLLLTGCLKYNKNRNVAIAA